VDPDRTGITSASSIAAHSYEGGIMTERQLVEFVGAARRELAEDFRRQLAEELRAVFTAEQRQPQAITVSRSFTGYAPNVRNSVVLGVGVRFEDGFESHIVKVGSRGKVEPDATGWKNCTAGREVSSRILHPVRHYPGQGRPVLAFCHRGGSSAPPAQLR